MIVSDEALIDLITFRHEFSFLWNIYVKDIVIKIVNRLKFKFHSSVQNAYFRKHNIISKYTITSLLGPWGTPINPAARVDDFLGQHTIQTQFTYVMWCYIKLYLCNIKKWKILSFLKTFVINYKKRKIEEKNS